MNFESWRPTAEAPPNSTGHCQCAWLITELDGPTLYLKTPQALASRTQRNQSQTNKKSSFPVGSFHSTGTCHVVLDAEKLSFFLFCTIFCMCQYQSERKDVPTAAILAWRWLGNQLFLDKMGGLSLGGNLCMMLWNWSKAQGCGGPWPWWKPILVVLLNANAV